MTGSEMSLTKARLPETDLARVALMATNDKWRALRGMRSGWSPISYRPARLHLPDALNIQRALPMIVESPSKDALLSAVRKVSGSDDEGDSNAEVVGLLYDFIRENEIVVVEEEFAPLRLAPGYSATYWANAVLRWGDRLLVVNTDFRRSTGYSALGQRFSTSVAHERIRKLGADYAEIELGFIRFPAPKDRPRSIELVVPQVELISYEELAAKTEETLSIWDQVCSEKSQTVRDKAANDDMGPLFGQRAKGDGTTG